MVVPHHLILIHYHWVQPGSISILSTSIPEQNTHLLNADTQFQPILNDVTDTFFPNINSSGFDGIHEITVASTYTIDHTNTMLPPLILDITDINNQSVVQKFTS